MKRLYPSMSELLAFEAAARHESFTLAASELCVTPGAISKAIGSLERFVGVQLFNRSNGGLVLSAAGKAYRGQVAQTLASLRAATLSIMAGPEPGGRLTLAAMPSFAERWLVPALGDFYARHPHVEVSFAPFDRASDFLGGIDCAIRYGTGQWADLESTYVVGREMVAITAGGPAGPVEMSAEDVLKGPLLHHHHFQDAWPRWCESQALSPSRGTQGVCFDQYGIIIRAVAEGLGSGLVPRCLVERDLAAGSVRLAWPTPYEAERGYYFCTSAYRSPDAVTTAFRSWLISRANQPSGEPDSGVTG